MKWQQKADTRTTVLGEAMVGAWKEETKKITPDVELTAGFMGFQFKVKSCMSSSLTLYSAEKNNYIKIVWFAKAVSVMIIKKK